MSYSDDHPLSPVIRMWRRMSVDDRLTMVTSNSDNCKYVTQLYWLTECEFDPAMQYCQTLREFNEL